MAANDGQSLSGQSADVQAAFGAANGGNASAAWDSAHNAAIGGGDTGQGGIPQIQTFNSAAAAAANQQAMLAYYEERLHQLEIPQMQAQTEQAKDQLAFQKAQQVWTQVYQQASMSGLQPTLDANGNPTGGFGTAPTQQAIKQQADITNQQDMTSLDYLKLLSTLNTPQNMFQYLKVLKGTPQGLQDVVNQSAGRMNAQGIPTYPNGVTPDHIAAAAHGAVSGLLGAYGQNPNSPATSNLGGTVNPDGSVSINGQDSNGNLTTPNASIGGMVNDVNNPGGVASTQDLNAAAGVVSPYQWNAHAIATMAPSQKGALESATQNTTGLMPDDQEAIFKSSLPIYGGPSHGNVTGMGY